MKAFQSVITGFAVVSMLLILPAYGQVPTTPTTTPCTASMLSSFTPCMNYLTNSSSAGTSPTADCCSSLRSLMTNGTNCLCQIVMGGVPFRIPINRTLAVSLPRACNQAGVPIQCKASPGAPVPAPGPTAFGPSASPAGAVSPSPSAGTVPATETPTLAPVSETTPTLTPPTTDGSLPPTSTTTGEGSTLTPSAAMPSFNLSPAFLLFSFVVMIMNYF